jgi:hypothetical protein
MHVDSRLAQLCLKGQCFMSYLNPRSDTSYFHTQYKTKGTKFLGLYGIFRLQKPMSSLESILHRKYSHL